MTAPMLAPEHKNSQADHRILSIDTLLIVILAIVSVEFNVPFALDQLDDNRSIESMIWIKPFIAPGEANPLILMHRFFTPLKLIIRSLTVIFILGYVLCDLLKYRYSKPLKTALLALIVMLHVCLPAGLLIIGRIAADNTALAHDGGVIQIEESMRFLLNGKNPYANDFSGTPLENWRGFKNNIIYHVPYMPGAFLYPLPFYMAWTWCFDFYDQRILHLALFLGSIYVLKGLFKEFSNRMCAITTFALFPFITRFVILGTNDIIMFFLILLTLRFLSEDRMVSAFCSLGCAAAIKQLAWFFIPFVFLYGVALSAKKISGWRLPILRTVRAALPGLAITALTVLPFVFWDPIEFYRDTFLYGSGGLPTSYPMQGFHGYGFATFLLFFNIVPNGNAHFPFGILQLATVIPLMAVLAKRLINEPLLSRCIGSTGLSLSVFMYFSRYFHGNFVGFSVFWIILAYFLNREEMRQEE